MISYRWNEGHKCPWSISTLGRNHHCIPFCSVSWTCEPLDFLRNHPLCSLGQWHRSIASISSSLRSSCTIGYRSTLNKIGRLLPVYQSYPLSCSSSNHGCHSSLPWCLLISIGNTQWYLSNESRVTSHVSDCFIQKSRKTTLFKKKHINKRCREQVDDPCPRLGTREGKGAWADLSWLNGKNGGQGADV